MQVRAHRARGLELHLERLERDSRELFGLPVDRERVWRYLNQATGSLPGDLLATVRRGYEANEDQPLR
jgi:hypothetical protein